MVNEDYPSIYQAANHASNKAQKTYLNSIKLFTFLLIIGTALSIGSSISEISGLLSALVFLSSLIVSIIIAVRRSELVWYHARAVAESVKTGAWRFMMMAEPYRKIQSAKVARYRFTSMLQKILEENTDLAQKFHSAASASEQVTTKMNVVRALSLIQRKEVYRKERIDDQITWYSNKSRRNQSQARFWFCIVLALQAMAIISLIMRFISTEWTYWPTEIFAVAAAGVMSWLQLKRFQELSTSYTSAAREIKIIQSALQDVDNEDDFSALVEDAESAFSREHSQWVARRVLSPAKYNPWVKAESSLLEKNYDKAEAQYQTAVSRTDKQSNDDNKSREEAQQLLELISAETEVLERFNKIFAPVSKPAQPNASHSLSNPGKEMIKILFLAANPKDRGNLRLDEEVARIDKALRKSEFRDRFELKQHWAVQVSDLQEYLLRYKPSIVHFSGHGSKSNAIILENNEGKSQAVSRRALSTLFSVLKDNIRCIILNACYTAEQAAAISEHIDVVIGMSDAIGDDSAVNFSASFYQALGYGRNVKTAFDLGCAEIDMQGLNEQDIPTLLSLKNRRPEDIFFVAEK